MAKVIIGLVAATVIFVVHSRGETCGPNGEYTTCVPICPEYCNVDDKRFCTLECKPGCTCAVGFIRESANSNKCISTDECQKMRNMKCEETKKEFNTCGSACPKYCGEPNGTACIAVCVPGCFCKKGYVLKSANSSECILESQCP